MRGYGALIVFLVLVMGGGALIGTVTAPGEWYAGLAKPAFNPPNWVFAPVWTLLYVMIALAGWRTWERERSRPAMSVWVAQFLLNLIWSPVFFGAQMLGAALIIILLMLALILTFIALSWREDNVAAWLFVPYAAWVGFATLLNASIWWLN